MSLYAQAQYTRSAHELKQLPPDEGFEAAFAGLSNSGKSSAINALTGRRKLAHTSKTPGRTQQINFFDLDEQRRLVDLPGYGYAKVPLSIKQHWEKVLEGYLRKRRSLCGLVLMMDVRRPLKEHDHQMLLWCEAAEMPVHVLLTKADKLSRGQGMSILQKLRGTLARDYSMPCSAQLFSALKRNGVEELAAVLDAWLHVGET